MTENSLLYTYNSQRRTITSLKSVQPLYRVASLHHLCEISAPDPPTPSSGLFSFLIIRSRRTDEHIHSLSILAAIRNFPIGLKRSGPAQQAQLSAGSGIAKNSPFKMFRLNLKQKSASPPGSATIRSRVVPSEPRSLPFPPRRHTPRGRCPAAARLRPGAMRRRCQSHLSAAGDTSGDQSELEWQVETPPPHHRGGGQRASVTPPLGWGGMTCFIRQM